MAVDIPVDLRSVPQEPGVYLFRDGEDRVLYVGKAARLRDRVGSYRQETDRRKRAMLQRVASVETILTRTEKEALILESNLIKEHRPPFNVVLADDKRYPYIALTDHEYPRLLVTRNPKRGWTTFGPFPDAGAAKRTHQVLREVLRLRDCKELIPGGCLNYQMDLCWGPCIQDPDERRAKAADDEVAEADPDAAYAEAVARASAFLRGDTGDLVEELRREMEAAAGAQRYERAARLRDRIHAIQTTLEKQAIFSRRREDRDAFALAREGDLAVGVVQLQRRGKVVGQEHYFLRETGGEDDELLGELVSRYYEHIPEPPREVLLPRPVPGAEGLASWLSDKRGTRVRLHVPQRGEKRRLVEMVERNAQHKLQQQRLRRGEVEGHEELEALADLLDLPQAPRVIEAYDISHLGGTDVVASRVVLVDGQPAPDRYRRYKIHADRNDDFAAMAEVVRRRFQHVVSGEGSDADVEAPDLVLIDGGRGQLGAAIEALEGLGLGDQPVSALAKREEEVFVPRRRRPVDVPRRSKALHVLMRARDEAHRFAVDYQRRLRHRRAKRGVLEDVPGLGPKRARALLKRFGSLQGVQEASWEDLAETPGLGPVLARRVRTHLDTMEAGARRRGPPPRGRPRA